MFALPDDSPGPSDNYDDDGNEDDYDDDDGDYDKYDDGDDDFQYCNRQFHFKAFSKCKAPPELAFDDDDDMFVILVDSITIFTFLKQNKNNINWPPFLPIIRYSVGHTRQYSRTRCPRCNCKVQMISMDLLILFDESLKYN